MCYSLEETPVYFIHFYLFIFSAKYYVMGSSMNKFPFLACFYFFRITTMKAADYSEHPQIFLF